jgi:uncharacterized membrane protein YphA (DoxX/SURF4 family)
MQRLFSTFPNGAPGAGLLLLRAVLGASFLVLAFALVAAPGTWYFVVGAVAAVAGISLVVGFLTPLAVSLGLVVFGIALARPPPSIHVETKVAVVIAVITGAATVALLGPGAFSLDARRFGRREITIPRDRSPPPD